MMSQRKMKPFGQMSRQRWRDASSRGLPGAAPCCFLVQGDSATVVAVLDCRGMLHSAGIHPSIQPDSSEQE